MCCQYVWSILSIEKKPCQQPLVESVFMDLSKAFYCISHDMLIEKFPVYGFRETTLKHIFTYLKNRRHCVYLNSTYGNFKDIISSDLQVSIVDPNLFNRFLNNFLCIKPASVHNFADNNTLSSLIFIFVELITVLH